LLTLNLHEGVVIWAERKVSIAIHFLFAQVIIALS